MEREPREWRGGSRCWWENAGLDQLVCHLLSGFNLSHMSPFSSVGCGKTSRRLYGGHLSCVLTRGFIQEFSSRPFLGLILVFRQPKPNWVPTACTANALIKKSVSKERPTFPPISQKESGLSLSEPFRILLLWMLMGPCKWHDFLVCVSGRIQDCKPLLTALQLGTKIMWWCPLN